MFSEVLARDVKASRPTKMTNATAPYWALALSPRKLRGEVVHAVPHAHPREQLFRRQGVRHVLLPEPLGPTITRNSPVSHQE